MTVMPVNVLCCSHHIIQLFIWCFYPKWLAVDYTKQGPIPPWCNCYARNRNQMQTRADAEIVVYSVGDRKPGDQKYEVPNDRQENSQGWPESKNQKSSKPKTNRDKGSVVYYITINWLTINRHRIKINVLTEYRRADWSKYTRRLNILWGSRGVRRD